MSNNTNLPICKTCNYFHEQPFYHEIDKGKGRCHRFPPVFTDASSGEKIYQWQFPLVYFDSYCGEHSIKTGSYNNLLHIRATN